MKISIAADIHLGIPNRLDDIIWALRKMADYNKAHNIKHLVILGDLLHDREQMGIKDLCAITELLEEIQSTYKQEVIAFPGNHDMYMKNSWDITSLRPLSKHLTYINTVSAIEIGGHKIWILPFIHYEADYMKAFKKIKKQAKKGDYLFTHIGVRGAKLNSCFLLKSWSVVDLGNNPFAAIYAGHFHNFQQVGNNMYYVGSPIPFKFDEGDVDHGFIVLDLDKNEHEFVSIWDGVKDGPPQFMTLDDKMLKSKTQEEISGNIVRVALFEEYTNHQMAEMRQYLEGLGAKTVRFINWASKEDKEAIELAKNNAATASELFKRFVEADKKGVKELNQAILLKLNNEITAEGDRRYV
jgi:DNA repair exonuclease SbcCD nuclease subunit